MGHSDHKKKLSQENKNIQTEFQKPNFVLFAHQCFVAVSQEQAPVTRTGSQSVLSKDESLSLIFINSLSHHTQ